MDATHGMQIARCVAESEHRHRLIILFYCAPTGLIVSVERSQRIVTHRSGERGRVEQRFGMVQDALRAATPAQCALSNGCGM